MAPDLQQYYDNQFSMMATPGWADIIEDFTRLKASINDITLTTDTQDLFFRKGQLDILDLVLKRKDTCEKVYEELDTDETDV
jgi:hypothetical protein